MKRDTQLRGDKLIYKAESQLYFFVSVLLRLAYILLLIYLLNHFDENPVVVGIGIVLIILMILFWGSKEIHVYEDRVVDMTTSLANYLSISKPRVIQMADIQSASSDFRYILRFGYQINLHMKGGRDIYLFIKVSETKLGFIIEAINNAGAKNY